MCSQLLQMLGSFVTGSDAPKVGYHLAFTFVNGWLNGLTMRRYRSFSTMMVGNTILLMNSLTCVEEHGVHSRFETCPHKRERAFFYAELIGAFCVGAIIAHVLSRTCEWPPKLFAPIFVFVALLVEAFHKWVDIENEYPDAIAVVLACVFGMSAHLTLKGGLGALPWCTTGNIIAACFHGVTAALTPNEEDVKKLLQNILLWVSFALGVWAGVRHFQEGYLLLCTFLLAGLLGLNDLVFMKRNTGAAMGGEAGAGKQDAAAPIQACLSDASVVSSKTTMASQGSMRRAAAAYEAARASFDVTPYMSAAPSLGMQHQASLGMQPQASLSRAASGGSPTLRPIREGSETLNFGAVGGDKP